MKQKQINDLKTRLDIGNLIVNYLEKIIEDEDFGMRLKKNVEKELKVFFKKRKKIKGISLEEFKKEI